MSQIPNEKGELYRLLVENAMDALIICDEKANLIYVSPSMEKLSGYKRDELIGRNAVEFYPPEEIPASKERLKMMTDGKEFSSIQFHFRKKAGDYIWGEMDLKPVKTANGVRRIVVVARDITERRNLQTQLKERSENLERRVAERSAELNKTKDYLQQLVSRLPLALVAWDAEFKAKTSNPEATNIFGTSEREFMEKDISSLFPAESKLAVRKIWKQLEKEESFNTVEENVTENGKKILCSWVNSPLRDSKGNLEGVLSMIQDISEEKKLEERVKEIVYSLSGVKAGESYLVGSLPNCLKIAFDLYSHGVKGLFVLRENPDSLIKDYNFSPEDIVLLSLKGIREFKAINDLQEVAILISKFVKKGGGVVVLGGLEYLISRHGFNAVFMMIQEKRFEFLESGATLLVPVNMATLDTREKGLLNSELKLLN